MAWKRKNPFARGSDKGVGLAGGGGVGPFQAVKGFVSNESEAFLVSE